MLNYYAHTVRIKNVLRIFLHKISHDKHILWKKLKKECMTLSWSIIEIVIVHYRFYNYTKLCSVSMRSCWMFCWFWSKFKNAVFECRMWRQSENVAKRKNVTHATCSQKNFVFYAMCTYTAAWPRGACC
jgi:hypothetical protein